MKKKKKWVKVMAAKQIKDETLDLGLKKYAIYTDDGYLEVYSEHIISDGDYILIKNNKVLEVKTKKLNLYVILKSFFLSFLIFFNAMAIDAGQFDNFNNNFDYNKLTGGNVDKQGIRNFSNEQKNKWLSSPDSVKSKVKDKVNYNESKLNGDISDIEDTNAKQKLIELMSNMTSTSKYTYKCYKERVVSVKRLFQCSLTNDVFEDANLCQDKCIKQYECNQASCVQTDYCTRLSGGYVCKMQMTQCYTSKICPSGGYYNPSTDKCEASVSNKGCRNTTTFNGKTWCVLVDKLSVGCTKGSVSAPTPIEVYLKPAQSLVAIFYGNSSICDDDWSDAYLDYTGDYSGSYHYNCRSGIRNGKTIYITNNGNSVKYIKITRFKQAHSGGGCDFYHIGLLKSKSFCPSGYTYNASRNICEANYHWAYSCPYGNSCVEDRPGIAYCSPYSCHNTSAGVWCATGSINQSGMTTNNITMYQCSYDGSWYAGLDACKTGCNYWKCSYNNNWYEGDKSVCEIKCREQGQCVELNQ